MKRIIVFSGIFFVMIALCVAGCAKKKQQVKEMDTLKSQIGSLSSELERMEKEQEATRELLRRSEEQRIRMKDELESIKAGLVKVEKGEEKKASYMYRTPSGFEIPTVDLQKALKNAGCYKGPIDGVVGKHTKQAIQDFQKENDLKADGVCGKKTWAKLSEYLKPVK